MRVPVTPLRAADLPGAGPDAADPAANNDFLDAGAARPPGKPDGGGPAVSLLELADVAQSRPGTSPEDTPPKEPEPKSAEPARTPWTILWRKHVTNPTSASRPATMRHKLTASALTSLARWTPYLESEMCGLRTVVRPGSVCIDVGSAADLYTTVLSRLAGHAGQVHSIEPLPFAHLLWARLLNARRACNVRHHCLALGTEAGSGPMSVPVGPYGLVTGRSYLMRQAGGPDSNAEFAGQVPVIVTVEKLDDFCAREAISRVDFVKVDVEGAELQVLEGGKGVIETHRPTMLIEIEARHTARYGHSPEDVSGWLLERGYTMHTWRHGWREAGRVEPGIRNYLFRALASSGPDDG